jgi:S1-C subfamily serine protease
MERVALPDEVADADTPPRAGPHRRRPRLIIAGVAALVVAVALFFWWSANPAPPALTRADVDRAVAKALERSAVEQRRTPPDAAVAYRTILPSLVTITTGGTAGAPAAPTTEGTLGTGVVVSDQGSILTALHVVGDNPVITVFFADGTRSTARVVTRRPANDIAVLAPERLPQVVVPAVLGGAVGVGDAVFPVGNPLGLRGSLSAGVVSALGRRIMVGPGRTIEGLIQFDAAVNPGSSGGPLLNRDGQVVGIVTALANPSEQPYFVGIGFAVPIATAGGAAGGPQQ